jgi:MerR family mercuric resistance operon transcriptional regulator
MNRPSLSIGQVAAAAGVPVDTVRYYERRGVLPPIERRRSGYRAFRPETVDRIAFVKELQALGFTLDEVIAVLELIDSNAPVCATARVYAGATLDRIDAKIRALSETRQRLASLLERCLGDPCARIAEVAPRVRLPPAASGLNRRTNADRDRTD